MVHLTEKNIFLEIIMKNSVEDVEIYLCFNTTEQDSS